MSGGRLAREQKTIQYMISIFCKYNHREKEGLCLSCKELLEYSFMRLNKCNFGTDKPICQRCKVHCYKQDMRERIKQVMRFSGRRMVLTHPVLTIGHLMDLSK